VNFLESCNADEGMTEQRDAGSDQQRKIELAFFGEGGTWRRLGDSVNWSFCGGVAHQCFS
jgi:hypothetical protein